MSVRWDHAHRLHQSIVLQPSRLHRSDTLLSVLSFDSRKTPVTANKAIVSSQQQPKGNCNHSLQNFSRFAIKNRQNVYEISCKDFSGFSVP